MTSTKIAIFLFSSVLAFTVLERPAAADNPEDIFVVANRGVPVNAITLADLKQIFLKQRRQWSGSLKVVPVNSKRNDELRNRFRQALLKITKAEEDNYWEDQKIRNGMKEPPVFSNVLKAVFHLKGSIGYVYRKDYKEGVVKILAVIPVK